MRRFWCTSCFVRERLSDALLFASSNLTNTNSRANMYQGYLQVVLDFASCFPGLPSFGGRCTSGRSIE